nr:MAG TPA: hypothetical protein [Caudoviricetes sp.]
MCFRGQRSCRKSFKRIGKSWIYFIRKIIR